MKICVFGLWHLGCVTAACLADLGFKVTGLDTNEENIFKLNTGQAPIYEPGLNETIARNISENNLSFTTDLKSAIKDVDVIWVTFDTPVSDDDEADVDYVKEQLKNVLREIQTDTMIIISSQVPVGFTKEMEQYSNAIHTGNKVTFAYSPENLRLGKSLTIFKNPDRIIIGIRNSYDMELFEKIFNKISVNLEWMSTESAEMTKHAINSFLALSVTFANELACLCEQVGANAKEVERGLKSEERIGPKAYLGPGSSFAGGTLARDTVFLSKLGQEHQVQLELINAIKLSNDYHKDWSKRRINEFLGTPKGKRVAVLGLTYKPGTDTLRRSLSIELCKWLSEQGAEVKAFDPRINELPEIYKKHITLCDDVVSCLSDADCAVLSTEWSQFKEEVSPEAVQLMRRKIVIDANGFLDKNFKGQNEVLYSAVGRRNQ